MMYTVNYSCVLMGIHIPVKNIGAIVEPSARIVIKFAVLEDAFTAARAVRKAGCNDVFVSNTEDPDARYLVPKEKEVILCTTS